MWIWEKKRGFVECKMIGCFTANTECLLRGTEWIKCPGILQAVIIRRYVIWIESFATLNTNLLWPILGIITYLVTHWSTVLPAKLTGLQLVKKFPIFYVTRKFITAFTSARHLSLSWANSIQSIPPHPTSWRSILILSSHLRLRLPSCLFPLGFPTKTLYIHLPPYKLHAQPISFFSILSPAQYSVSSTDH